MKWTFSKVQGSCIIQNLISKISAFDVFPVQIFYSQLSTWDKSLGEGGERKGRGDVVKGNPQQDNLKIWLWFLNSCYWLSGLHEFAKCVFFGSDLTCLAHRNILIDYPWEQSNPNFAYPFCFANSLRISSNKLISYVTGSVTRLWNYTSVHDS